MNIKKELELARILGEKYPLSHKSKWLLTINPKIDNNLYELLVRMNDLWNVFEKEFYLLFDGRLAIGIDKINEESVDWGKIDQNYVNQIAYVKLNILIYEIVYEKKSELQSVFDDLKDRKFEIESPLKKLFASCAPATTPSSDTAPSTDSTASVTG